MAETLDSISIKYASDLQALGNTVGSDLQSLGRTIFPRLVLAPSDSDRSADVYDWAITAYSEGVGDSTKGIYGKYVIGAQKLSELLGKSVNSYITDHLSEFSSESSQSKIDAYMARINKISTDSGDVVSKLFSDFSTLFSDNLVASQRQSFIYYSKGITDSCLGRLDRALADTVSHLDQLLAKLGSGPVSDVDREDLNRILTESSDAYSKSVEQAISVYQSALSVYKYPGPDAQPIVDASQKLISDKISYVNQEASAKFSDVATKLSQLSGEASVAMVQLLARFRSDLFQYRVRQMSLVSNDTSAAIASLELCLRSVRNYLNSARIKQVRDSSTLRESIRAVGDQAENMLSDGVYDVQSTFVDAINSHQTDINFKISSLQSKLISDINLIGGLTQEDSDRFQLTVSTVVETLGSYISFVFTAADSRVGNIVDYVKVESEKLIKSFVSDRPIIRFLGGFTFPGSIDPSGTNTYSFSVQNVGEAAWYGWFNLRFEGSADPPVSRYVNGTYVVILPGATYVSEFAVPGTKFYNLVSPIITHVGITTVTTVDRHL